MACQILTVCMRCNIPCQHSFHLCLGNTRQKRSPFGKLHSLTILSHRGHGISRALHSNTIHIPIQTLMACQIVPHRLIQRLSLLLSQIRCQLTTHINSLNLIIEHLHTPRTRNLLAFVLCSQSNSLGIRHNSTHQTATATSCNITVAQSRHTASSIHTTVYLYRLIICIPRQRSTTYHNLLTIRQYKVSCYILSTIKGVTPYLPCSLQLHSTLGHSVSKVTFKHIDSTCISRNTACQCLLSSFCPAHLVCYRLCKSLLSCLCPAHLVCYRLCESLFCCLCPAHLISDRFTQLIIFLGRSVYLCCQITANSILSTFCSSNLIRDCCSIGRNIICQCLFRTFCPVCFGCYRLIDTIDYTT